MAYMRETRAHSSIKARNVRPFNMAKQIGDAAVRELALVGIHIDPLVVHDQVRALCMDSAVANISFDSAFTPSSASNSIATPLQFLQVWLPGFVKVMTAARKIDKLVGIKTIGSWEDQEIVQGFMQPTAQAYEYGDYSNVPLSNWVTDYERRTIVRGEHGLQVGLLEEARASAIRVESAAEKRQASAIALEMLRNAIGFFGWNSGNNRTFGFLNDPNAISPQTVSGGSWSQKNAQAIIADLRLAISTLRNQSGDQIDPEEARLTLAVPTNRVDYLTAITDFGISVRDWLTQTYKNIRIVSAPELNGSLTNYATTGTFMLYADEIDSSVDGSTDGGEVWVQLVQTKFMQLGVEKRVKTYVEDFANATAGTMLKRAWALTTWNGI